MNDLDLVVDLVNTVYALADPPDRLTTVDHFRVILRGAGQSGLAEELADGDLDRLRELREQLRPAFGCDTDSEAMNLVNGLLREHAVVPQLSRDTAGAIRLDAGGVSHGLAALAGRLVAALAEHLVRHGVRRLGVCAATPCECVFVDRTRPGTRKYCCDTCNDRVAAAAHYRRRRANRRD
ncbi:CGNR zinc finger domain-containing protein [Nocardia sp. NPDC020380]|uniref:CGNR zinc finger domain-containing protein n=1 Tax=Nocardia sp. NPDC020380 TaxID=3364309 RepID=UPI00378B2D76